MDKNKSVYRKQKTKCCDGMNTGEQDVIGKKYGACSYTDI